MEKVIVYEGTFDPPHIGHLWLLQIAREKADIRRAIVVPNMPSAAQDISKKKKVSGLHDRLAMCQRTFNSTDTKVVRPYRKYTYEILDHLATNDTRLYWLCGPDMCNLNSFKGAPGIWQRHSVILVTAGDILRIWSLKPYTRKDIGRAPICWIRSTYIRQRIKEGKTINGLVSLDTEGYIKANNLYN